MRIQDLKHLLIHHLERVGKNTVAVHQEVLNQVITGKEASEIKTAEILGYEVEDTAVFLSDAGFSKPKRVIFVDLKSGKSFLQEIEM